MQPIKEFSFDELNTKLAKLYLKIHNNIYKDVMALRSQSNDVSVKNYLDIFLSQFTLLDKTIPSDVLRTIICCSQKKVKIFCANHNEFDLDKTLKIGNLNTSMFNTKAKNYLNKKLLESADYAVTLREVLSLIFNYSGKRKHLLKYYSSKDYNVCLFCLAQSTTTYTSSRNKNVYLTGNLDHVHPKSKFPFLSVSLNNLIPVCAHCNQRKSDDPFEYNPFNDKHNHNFDFTNCLSLDRRTHEVTLKSLKHMKIIPGDQKFEDLSQKLDFTDLYKNFQGNAKIMVERFAKFNSKGYTSNLKSILKTKDVNADVKYFISEIPLVDENILKYPLTKFKIDLYKELKQKYDQNRLK